MAEILSCHIEQVGEKLAFSYLWCRIELHPHSVPAGLLVHFLEIHDILGSEWNMVLAGLGGGGGLYNFLEN